MRPEELIAKVFGVDPHAVDDATSNTNLPEWDSLGHVTLIMEIESTYGVSLSAEDALAMTDLGSIKRILELRGARW